MAAGTSGAKRQDIQALRALAVVLVVVFHAGVALPGGFVGVDVFFVISGYVITGLLYNELRSSGSIDFRMFYARRARRLLPPLALVMAATLGASVLLLAPTGAQQAAGRTARAASLFAANLHLYRFEVPYFSPRLENPFLHMWSLAVEEQTYLVLPAFLWLLWRAGRRIDSRKMLGAGLALASLVSFALALAAEFDFNPLHIPKYPQFAFYLPFTRLWEFGVGAGLALFAGRIRRSERLGLILGCAGLGAVLASAVLFDETVAFPGWRASIPVLGTAALITAGSMSKGWVNLTSRRSVVWLGDVSYEWYLWHWPFIVFFAYQEPSSTWHKVLAAVLSLALAGVTRSVLARSFRYNERLVGRRAAFVALVCILLPAVLATGVLRGAATGWGVPALREAMSAQYSSEALVAGCADIARTDGCFFSSANSQGTLALVGDSHAIAISDMVSSIADEESLDFATWTRGSCPLVLDVRLERPECVRWSELVVSWLREIAPRVVVIHVATTGYLSDGTFLSADGESLTGEDAASAYAAGLERAIQGIQEGGSRIVILKDVPRFDDSLMPRATLVRPNPPPVELRLADVRAQSALLAPLLDSLGSPSVVVADPVALLCSSTRCSQFDGVWLFGDSNHVSAAGAERVRGVVDVSIRQLLVD